MGYFFQLFIIYACDDCRLIDIIVVAENYPVGMSLPNFKLKNILIRVSGFFFFLNNIKYNKE